MSLLASKCFIINNLVRNLHITPPTYGYIGRTMKKVLKGTMVKRKHKYVSENAMPTPKEFTKGANEGKRSVNIKRTAVLNKLFMRYITDLMANGDSAPCFTGLGIEISRVQVSSDFRYINVLWLAKGTSGDSVIQDVLDKNRYALRHELTQLRVMGHVPEIRFVKDKQMGQIMEVELRLANADFGNDYVPTDASQKLKTELQLLTRIEPHIKEKIDELSQRCAEEEQCEENIPEMPQNVLGLNHHEIMQRVLRRLKGCTSSYEETESPYREGTYINQNPVEFSSRKAQSEAFQRFLKERVILQKKMNESDKNDDRYELESLREEFERKRENMDGLDLSSFYDDADYIEEEDLK